MRSVGIDIGSFSIKVVEVNSSNKGISVVQFFEKNLPQTPGSDPEIEIIEFLREISQRFADTPTQYVMGLRQEKVSVRHKIFPFSERLKIQKSLPFELEEDLPFASDSAIFDAKVVRYIGNQAELLACATPRYQVSAMMDRFNSSHLSMDILSCEGVAISSLFEKWNDPILQESAARILPTENEHPEQELRKLNAVLNIGHTHTVITVFENQRVVGSRSLLWGGKNIAEAIAKRYGIPYIEALQELRSKGFVLPTKENASHDQITFSDTISASLKELTRELNITLLEFKSDLNGEFDSLQLTGGVSQLQNLGAFLTQHTEIACNRISSFANFHHIQFERTTDRDATLSIALAYAIEGQRKPRNPAVNFLRGEFAKQNAYWKGLWEKWNKTIQATAAALAIFLVYGMIRESLSTNLLEKTQEVMKVQAVSVAKLNKKAANEAGLKKFKIEQTKRIKEMKNLATLAQMNSSMDILKKVSEAVPPKNQLSLDVKKFHLADQDLNLEGHVHTQKEADTLSDVLKTVAIDGKVQSIQPTIPAMNGKIPFAFQLRVDRGLNKVVK